MLWPTRGYEARLPGMENRERQESRHAHGNFEVFVGDSGGDGHRNTWYLGLGLRKGVNAKYRDLGINKKQMSTT